MCTLTGYTQQSVQGGIILYMNETAVSTSGITSSILIIDEDKMISDLIHYNLENEGYSVISCTSTAEALDLDLTTYSLIITEALFRDCNISGLRFTEMLKQNPDTATVPVIICSTLDSEDDIINGFNAGADDYILKPFSLREMVARVKSVIRRHQIQLMRMKPRSHQLTFNGLSIDMETNKVTIDGQPISLSRTEQHILVLFLRNINKYFKRNEIYEKVWIRQEQGSDRIVDVNISRIRKKIGPYAANIINRSGVGYGFMEQTGL